jgi:hypothetical protein
MGPEADKVLDQRRDEIFGLANVEGTELQGFRVSTEAF